MCKVVYRTFIPGVLKVKRINSVKRQIMNMYKDFTLKRTIYFELSDMSLKNRFFSNMLCTVKITFAYEKRERERELNIIVRAKQLTGNL